MWCGVVWVDEVKDVELRNEAGRQKVIPETRISR